MDTFSLLRYYLISFRSLLPSDFNSVLEESGSSYTKDSKTCKKTPKKFEIKIPLHVFFIQSEEKQSEFKRKNLGGWVKTAALPVLRLEILKLFTFFFHLLGQKSCLSPAFQGHCDLQRAGYSIVLLNKGNEHTSLEQHGRRTARPWKSHFASLAD